MTIIFPMAGLSSRFAKAGYKLPKYMLTLKNKSVFQRAVESFENFFNKNKILFIYRNIENSKEFIKEECMKMKLEFYECCELKSQTKGQAHTVMLGIKKAKIDPNESILIFNIDTFHPDFTLPKELDFSKIDGYLEVFKADGEQWSFVKADKKGLVLQTAEKQRISELCSSGLYYFKRAKDFERIFKEIWQKNELVKNEFYIAPMYNYLIKEGADIRCFEVDSTELIFCGTPLEYETLKQNL